MPAKQGSELERTLGHRFARPELLQLALTHSSVAYENALQNGDATHSNTPREDNEQLEFLGDAALGLLVAEDLYRRFPALHEGDLTRLRANLVSRKYLGEVGARLELGTYLHLGKSEERSGGRRKAALMANAMEAVFAAIYLDGGLEALRKVVGAHVVQPALPELEAALNLGKFIGDYKSSLQEQLQAAGLGQPRYVVTDESGPDHHKYFGVEVLLLRKDGSLLPLARAKGHTKKAAQQEAARLACEHLSAQPVAAPPGATVAAPPSHAPAEKHLTESASVKKI